MSTLNPFTANSLSLKTGFYFDKEDYQIVYVYKDETSYENSYIQTYTKLNRSANPEMLVELSEVESSLNKMDTDFEWICRSESVRESFVDFLLENELYLLMEQFKTFCETCSVDNKEQRPFKYGDIVEAVDNFYEITRKDQHFVGEVVGVLLGGVVQVRILKHDQTKYVGLVVRVRDHSHIRKIN